MWMSDDPKCGMKKDDTLSMPLSIEKMAMLEKNHLQLKTCALHVATKHIENVVTIDKNKSVT